MRWADSKVSKSLERELTEGGKGARNTAKKDATQQAVLSLGECTFDYWELHLHFQKA